MKIERLDPLPLFRLIQQRGVTVWDAVPSFQRHCTNALLELAPSQSETNCSTINCA